MYKTHFLHESQDEAEAKSWWHQRKVTAELKLCCHGTFCVLLFFSGGERERERESEDEDRFIVITPGLGISRKWVY